ncbi:unnamed protein product [Polarella glacialis]|uniref:rRNA methyltransferase 2, mitochondrial n=1 Tax=Polarella glacialis TaxID=89957 RepID=A0A813EVI9_POLGL|nr:unnamed protein product [Polarella glacialis]
MSLFASAIRRSFGHKPYKGHSSQWIQRHTTDPYVQRAQQDMYRSRAAYKLKQMDQQYSIFTKKSVVIDIGCFAGSWSQVAMAKTGAATGKSNALVIGVDLVEMDPLDHHHFVRGDIREVGTLRKIDELLRGRKASIVLSDMAPRMTGSRIDDHIASVDLSKAALRCATNFLQEGGWFVLKVFQGGMLDRFKAELTEHFGKIRTSKPKASRPESVEVYLVCSDFLGPGGAGAVRAAGAVGAATRTKQDLG